VTASRLRVLVAVAVAAALLGGLIVGRYVVPDDDATASADPTTPAGAPSAVDIGFGQDMATHHAQAIRMADTVRGRVSPEVDAVAAHVFETQVHESGVLKGWLQLWDAPQLPSGPPMTWLADHQGRGEHGGLPPTSAPRGEAPPMPGMASQEDVNRLEDLSGTELEVWFLQLMVRHHEGGILMAQAAAEQAEVPAVRSLAAAIAVEQQTEVTLMLQLLDARDARSLPSS
jgi:uncharacterized protein (DUF305 family)